jgi:hypothetical protein
MRGMPFTPSHTPPHPSHPAQSLCFLLPPATNHLILPPSSSSPCIALQMACRTEMLMREIPEFRGAIPGLASPQARHAHDQTAFQPIDYVWASFDFHHACGQGCTRPSMGARGKLTTYKYLQHYSKRAAGLRNAPLAHDGPLFEYHTSTLSAAALHSIHIMT